MRRKTLQVVLAVVLVLLFVLVNEWARRDRQASRDQSQGLPPVGSVR